MTRDELIAALEAATGPHRGLDEKIAVLLSGATREEMPHGRVAYHKDGFWISIGEVLPYTSSIDAALSLVPSDHFWCLTMRGNRRGGFDACCLPEGEGMEWHTGATPAIALCIAALKAMS